MGTWGLAKAKAQLSEVVHRAESDGPQVITRSGREVAVLVSVEEWKKPTPAAEAQESLVDFLFRPELRGPDLPLRRRSKTRPVKF